MRAIALVLCAAVSAAACAAAPLEVEAYRTRVGGQPMLLVPVPAYRSLMAPPELPPAPSASPAPAPKPVPDRVSRVLVEGAVREGRAHLTLTCELDLGSSELRPVVLWPEARELVITRFRGPGELVPSGDGSCRVMTTARGPATLELSLIVPVVRAGHAWRLSVPLPSAPQQVVDLTLTGEKDVAVHADGGLVLSTAVGPSGMRVRAAGRGETQLALRWEAPVQVEAAPEVGAPAEQEFEPELSVQVATLAAVGDTHLKMRSTLAITVRRNPVREIVLAAGGTASFVDISGPQVAEWESAVERGMQVARVSLRTAVQDRVDLQVEYEMPMGDAKPRAANESNQASFVPVHVPAAYQEEHSLGVSRPPNLDLKVTPGGEWRELDPARVPPSLAALTGQTLARLMQCERFPRARRAEPPATVELSCRRLDEVQLLQATIDLMEAQTALTEDGHLLGRVTYRVRNNSQQFLRLLPPEGSLPLTVYVANKAVRAASDESGRWLIPLGKSSRTSSGAAPFDVEVTYLQQDQGVLGVGRSLKLKLPRADLGISTVRWKIALPKDWSLATRSTNMRVEPAYRPVEYAGNDAGGGARAPSALFDEATLPLAIELPKVPEVFHFSQDLLDKDAEPREVELVLSRSVPELTRRAAAFLVGVLFFYIVLRGRPEGRARVVATAMAVVGTGLLMALFGWASTTLGLTLHLALGLFMGTVIFGVSRLAVALPGPVASAEED